MSAEIIPFPEVRERELAENDRCKPSPRAWTVLTLPDAPQLTLSELLLQLTSGTT